MKNWWFILLLTVNIASAYTIADWPSFYVKNGKFNAMYIIGEEAPSLDVVSGTIISTSLAKFENVTTEIGTSAIDTEVADVTKKDAIVIGSPCENKAAAQLLGNPEPCNNELGGSFGYIKLFENNGKVQLLITGLNEKDRHSAAKYLAETDLKGLKTTAHIVFSGSGSIPSYFEKKNQTSNSTERNNTLQNATLINKTSLTAIQNNTKIQPEKKAGKYEPLKDLPRKKGIWEKFIEWLKRVFTIG